MYERKQTTTAMKHSKVVLLGWRGHRERHRDCRSKREETPVYLLSTVVETTANTELANTKNDPQEKYTDRFLWATDRTSFNRSICKFVFCVLLFKGIVKIYYCCGNTELTANAIILASMKLG